MPDPTPSATDELVNRLAAEIRKPAAPPAPPAPSRDDLMKRLDDAGAKGAGKYTEELVSTVLMPMQGQNIRAAAQLNRRIAEKDPDVGRLYKRYRDKVEARATELGGDIYIAEKGLESVIRSVASEDPAYIDEIADARVAEKIAARDAAAAAEAAKKAAEAAAAAPARRPPTETIHTGVVGAPAAAAPSEEEAIRAIEISDEDAALAKTIFRMTPTDVKRQRHEIAKMERKYGPIGIKNLGGVPICELRDMKTGSGAPYPVEED